MKVITVFLILSLLLTGTASAAGSTAVQPARIGAVPAVTTTTTAPVVTVQPARTVAVPVVTTTTTAAPVVTVQPARTVAVPVVTTTTTAAPVVTVQYPVNGPVAVNVSTAGQSSTQAGVVMTINGSAPATASAPDIQQATVVATPAMKTFAVSAAGSPVQQGVAVVTVPVVTATTAGAKPVSIVDSVISFFAGLFGGGGKSTGGTTPPSGGDLEPTPTLPGGMKPVTQPTTAKAQQPMNNDITVTSPVNGDTFYTTEPVTVKWVKPNNPLGTVTLRLLSQSGSTQTEWAHAIVQNTGEFKWFQQDLAHDCGLPGNVPCFGPNLSEMGIKSPITYTNAWDLPPYNNVRVEISTDAMDPYPAFYGVSGVFTIINARAFADTDLKQSKYFRMGDYPAQTDVSPVTPGLLPWVGYRHSQLGGTSGSAGIEHEIWRAIILPDLSSFHMNDPVKKAILTLKLSSTDKGTGNGVTTESHNVNTYSALSKVWVLNGDYTGFRPASQLPVIKTYDIPTTGGSNQYATFDAGTGTITIDVTDGVKEWFAHYSPHVIVLVGPDENEVDAPQFWYSQYKVESFTIEKA